MIPELLWGLAIEGCIVGAQMVVEVTVRIMLAARHRPVTRGGRWRYAAPPVLAGNVGAIIGALQIGQPWRVLVYGAAIVAVAAIWWWRRRKRRKAAQRLGAKAKALRATLVRTMRERTAAPRVLRPVRESA